MSERLNIKIKILRGTSLLISKLLVLKGEMVRVVMLFCGRDEFENISR